jgi:hypothetical protein
MGWPSGHANARTLEEDRPMLRLGTTTRRSPAEIVEKAIVFFGPAGLGLDVRERGQDTATFVGGGGYVTVRASARADGSEITVEAREWDHDVRRFVDGL